MPSPETIKMLAQVLGDKQPQDLTRMDPYSNQPPPTWQQPVPQQESQPGTKYGYPPLPGLQGIQYQLLDLGRRY
jgi:hypothetical protein